MIIDKQAAEQAAREYVKAEHHLHRAMYWNDQSFAGALVATAVSLVGLLVDAVVAWFVCWLVLMAASRVCGAISDKAMERAKEHTQSARVWHDKALSHGMD